MTEPRQEESLPGEDLRAGEHDGIPGRGSPGLPADETMRLNVAALRKPGGSGPAAGPDAAAPEESGAPRPDETMQLRALRPSGASSVRGRPAGSARRGKRRRAAAQPTAPARPAGPAGR
ncbi:hypothetical protein [Streptomyces thermodiastaticus]|uniref:hypothetical protein n=1 Tax=Streptomyces thermodiastaticus TaxID=44061 RepID=UPI0019AAE832|nr:hypothetical protein [Streptomyces thermodiastaticus]GHF72105.1 hypothetical protein GCM10018787_20870 [Streptomyces thermodiastaticus]